MYSENNDYVQIYSDSDLIVIKKGFCLVQAFFILDPVSISVCFVLELDSNRKTVKL